MTPLPRMLAQRKMRLPVLIGTALLWVAAVVQGSFGAASHLFIVVYLVYRIMMIRVDHPDDQGRSVPAHLLALLWVGAVVAVLVRAAILLMPSV